MGGRLNEPVFPSLPIRVRSVIRGGKSVAAFMRFGIGLLPLFDRVLIGSCLAEGGRQTRRLFPHRGT